MPVSRLRQRPGEVFFSAAFRSPVGQFGQPEVEHFDQAFRGDHHIRRLEIAMHDAGRVRLGKRTRNLRGVVQALAERQSLALDQIVQRLAFHVLHGDEMHAVGFLDVVDGDNVGVIERRSRFSFLHEAAPPLRVLHLVLRQHLDGDEAVQVRVTGLVNHAHAAFAEL